MNTEVSALGVFLRMCAKHRKAIGYWIPNNLRKNPAILRSFSPAGSMPRKPKSQDATTQVCQFKLIAAGWSSRTRRL